MNTTMDMNMLTNQKWISYLLARTQDEWNRLTKEEQMADYNQMRLIYVNADKPIPEWLRVKKKEDKFDNENFERLLRTTLNEVKASPDAMSRQLMFYAGTQGVSAKKARKRQIKVQQRLELAFAKGENDLSRREINLIIDDFIETNKYQGGQGKQQYGNKQQNWSKSNVTCSKCGKKGHYANECYSKTTKSKTKQGKGQGNK